MGADRVSLTKQAAAESADNSVQTDRDGIMNGRAEGSVPGRKRRAMIEGFTHRKGDGYHGEQTCRQ
jgi:hypothetical protein